MSYMKHAAPAIHCFKGCIVICSHSFTTAHARSIVARFAVVPTRITRTLVASKHR